MVYGVQLQEWFIKASKTRTIDCKESMSILILSHAVLALILYDVIARFEY
jgi:hypothetical protein